MNFKEPGVAYRTRLPTLAPRNILHVPRRELHGGHQTQTALTMGHFTRFEPPWSDNRQRSVKREKKEEGEKTE